MIDALDRPGQWSATARDFGGTCDFDNQGLVVTTTLSNVFRCKGPNDIFSGNQSVAADATVVTAGACAVIWFRFVSDSGYRVSLCQEEVRIGLDNEGEVIGELRAPSQAFQLGQRHRVGIDVHDDSATVTVDGARLLTMALTDPSLAAGQVVLGAINDVNSGDSVAAFANVEIRSQ